MTAILKKPVAESIQEFPAPASLGIEVNDLMYWDAGNSVAKPASSQADKLSEALNQAEFARNFIGISNSARQATDTVAGVVRVQTDGLFQLPCVSSTFEVGDLLGADEAASGTALEDQQVRKVLFPHLAIAVVTQRYASATTRVWCRLLSRRAHDLANRFHGVGGFQGHGSTALADANVTLTVDHNPICAQIPTAHRDITLPTEAQSAGLMFFFANNSAGAFNMVVKNAAAATLATIAQNKRGIAWCDGTTWFAAPFA